MQEATEASIGMKYRPSLLRAALYFLYTSEYSPCEAVSDDDTSGTSLSLPREDHDAIFHAEMYELGEFLQLPGLQSQAYRSFVRNFVLQCDVELDDNDTNSDLGPTPEHAPNHDGSDTESEAELETGLVEEEEILLASRVNKMRLGKAVEAVMCHERVSLMKPITDLMCLILIKVREMKDRPPASMDGAFSTLKERLAYTRLEDAGRHCGRCNQTLQHVKGCEHGWRCEDPPCTRKWVVPLFCHRCLEFVGDCDGSED